MRIIAIAAIPILALAGCNMVADAQRGGDGDAPRGTAERSFEVGAFEGVSLGGHNDVEVKVGGPVSVRAVGDAAELDRLEIEVRNGTLRIGEKRNIGTHRGKALIYVTVPSLSAAAIGGSGDMKIDRAESRRFAGSIGGSGDIEIGQLKAGEASFSIAGSGGIKAAGTADSAETSIAGSGDIDLAGLTAVDADISIVGSGNTSIRATRNATVSIMGSGDAKITGGARCKISKMGSGSVDCG